MTEPDKPAPTLYEWAGGESAIRRLMDCFTTASSATSSSRRTFPAG